MRMASKTARNSMQRKPEGHSLDRGAADRGTGDSDHVEEAGSACEVHEEAVEPNKDRDSSASGSDTLLEGAALWKETVLIDRPRHLQQHHRLFRRKYVRG